MKTNLSSQIKLERIPRRYYAPESDVERAALTREEKVYTRIFETVPEGGEYIARHAVDLINRKLKENGKCVIALGTGKDLDPVYASLVEMYKKGEVSFENVIVFNISVDSGTNGRTDSEANNSTSKDRCEAHFR